MSSVWGKVQPVETVNFNEIVDEELARTFQKKDLERTVVQSQQILEDFNFAQQLEQAINLSASEIVKNSDPVDPGEGYSKNLVLIDEIQSKDGEISIPVVPLSDTASTLAEIGSDEQIAQLLQAEFDLEYDEEVKRMEKSKNKGMQREFKFYQKLLYNGKLFTFLGSKIQVSFQKYRMYPDDLLFDSEEEEAEDPCFKKDFDKFDKNEKEISKIGRIGYKLADSGEMITKHDANLSGRRNACKVMSFDPEIHTGDAASFDMKLDNKVFNQLRMQSKQLSRKTNKALDRKENISTTQMGLDEPTRLILYKLINNQILESVDGVISTGKEAIILHAETDQNNPERPDLPKEVAIKIFSTTLNEFKQRDRYIKDDFRFKDRFSKQNNRTVIGMWAEKELHNLNRLKKAQIACPEVVLLKKHVLIMSFIGRDSQPAPKLKEAKLSNAEWICVYEEIVEIMCKMYREARLIHADFSEYNILWYDSKPIIIDVAQAVEPIHPAALEYLMRDCDNITNFFAKKGVPAVKSKEELFFYITNLDPLTSNTTMLERIHMKGDPVHEMTKPKTTDINAAEVDNVPDQFKPLEFPFDYAWQKVEHMKKKKRERKNSGKTVVDLVDTELCKEISVSGPES